MILLGLLAGLFLTVFGALASGALVTTSRRDLSRAISRRLRGGHESLAWLGAVDRELAAAAALTSVGIILMGAVFPALFAGVTFLRLALAVIGLGVPVVVLSGYLLPLWLSTPRADRVAAIARPLLQPVAALLAFLLPVRTMARPAEVRALIRQGTVAGFGPDQELVMVGGVIAFAQRQIRAIMTPRTDIVAVVEGASLEEIRRTFGESGYSRLPVYRETLDEIVGMVHVFDLFRIQPGDPLPIRPVAFAPATRPAGDLLVDLQRERRHLAVVLDEFGGTLGIVSMEDLLEEMVGEIYDEHDDLIVTPPAKPQPTLLEVDGATPVEEVEAQCGVRFPAGHTTTIAGRLVEVLGHIPVAGQRFIWRGLECDILRAGPTRIDRVVIRVAPPVPTPLSAGTA